MVIRRDGCYEPGVKSICFKVFLIASEIDLNKVAHIVIFFNRPLSTMLSKIFNVFIPVIALSAGLLGLYVLLLAMEVETVSLMFLVGFPFVAGVVIMYFRPKGTFQKIGGALIWMIGILLLAIFGSYVLGFEGLICIAMAIVPLLIGTIAGGFIYLLFLRGKNEGKNTLKIVTLPVFAIALLGQTLHQGEVYAISNSIVINAPPAVVFAMIQNIPDISPDEIPTRASHLLGVPKPTAAHWEENSNGRTRHSYWGEGVHFIERITHFEQNRRIAWDFEFPENWIVEGIEDPHVKVGGRYFDVLSGEYVLEDLGNQTRLSLTTRTLDSSGLGIYSEFWHHFFFEDFHESILSLVKTRLEASV